MTKLNFQENVLLSELTNFKVGGPARYFCDVYSSDDLIEAFKFIKEHNLEYLILSGGTNLIVSDQGFAGLVIRIKFDRVQVNDNIIEAEAGANLNDLVIMSTQDGLKGLEWAGGLPGELGGAIRGNAGAFGGEIKDVVSEVTSLDTSGKITVRSNNECNFGYRTSIFKANGEIIISAKLKFSPAETQELIKIADSRRQYRAQRHPIEYPCAGSIFKNIPLNTVSKDVAEIYQDVVKIDPFPVIPTAAVLDKLGLSGYQIGGAQVSTKHPNYIINANQASAKDIIDLIQFVIAKVAAEYKINLEVEPQLVGFENKYVWESN